MGRWDGEGVWAGEWGGCGQMDGAAEEAAASRHRLGQGCNCKLLLPGVRRSVSKHGIPLTVANSCSSWMTGPMSLPPGTSLAADRAGDGRGSREEINRGHQGRGWEGAAGRELGGSSGGSKVQHSRHGQLPRKPPTRRPPPATHASPPHTLHLCRCRAPPAWPPRPLHQCPGCGREAGWTAPGRSAESRAAA